VSQSRVLSVVIFFHHPSWKLRCWNCSWVSTKIKFHHSSNVLIHETGLTMSEVWRWWDILVRIEYLSNEISWYIVEKNYLSPAYSTWMTDQYGATPQDYVYDLMRLSSEHYTQGMLFFIELFPAIAEAYSSHFCYADGIWFYRSYSSTSESFHLWIIIPYISSLLGSVPPRACFPFNGWLLPLTWNLRRKWSKLHVIYFSVLICNWTSMM